MLPRTGRGASPRFKTRAGWWTESRSVAIVGAWLVLSLLGYAVGISQVVNAPSGTHLPGAVVLVVLVTVTWLLIRLRGPRLVVSGEGLSLRYPRRRVRWEDITSVVVTEGINLAFTHRQLSLVAVTAHANIPLAGTARRAARIGPVIDGFVSAAPLTQTLDDAPVHAPRLSSGLWTPGILRLFGRRSG